MAPPTSICWPPPPVVITWLLAAVCFKFRLLSALLSALESARQVAKWLLFGKLLTDGAGAAPWGAGAMTMGHAAKGTMDTEFPWSVGISWAGTKGPWP